MHTTSHTYRRLLPTLALVVSAPAWSQTAPGFGGPHRPPVVPAAAMTEAAADSPASAHYKFLTIGPEDSAYVVADGIDNAGLVTGYYEDASFVFHGFVWRNGTFQT